MKEQKSGLEEDIKNLEAENHADSISKADIKKIIRNLTQEIKHASPDTLRMIFNNLFQEIKINPKTKKSKHPQSRIIELKGISIPFTEVKLASPRGFEPLSPP